VLSKTCATKVTDCRHINFNLDITSMKTVTTVEFRRHAEGVLRRLAKGERFCSPTAASPPLAWNLSSPT